ncbi:5118_t:CDS:2 [Funneliformis geosporum]|uniref:7358_t:CDS:1 n=1 Tax=Funneliformis geosporum TaxID=1117311 RepID=A0A9W4SIG6_9GLOM|nr:7358_t:CDS:2 [Funneliformis geosporum]CAI2170250.1 5118_t:CDS:2 [Funneliformis geosporum]
MTSEDSTTVISPFDLLPDEICLRIFTELSVPTICLCQTVSKRWYYISQDESLWQHHCSLLIGPGPLPPRTSSTLDSWKKFYRLQLNWNSGTATKTFNFKAHDSKVISLKLRGNILITGSSEKCLGVWNIKTGKQEKEIHVGADIICVDFIEHKDVIACGSYYGDFGCKLFSLSTGKSLGEFREDHWIGTQCMDINDEYIILGTYNGMIHVLSWEDGRKIALFHIHNNRVAGVRLLGKNTAMSVSSNGAIDIFSISTNELLYQYFLPRTAVNICAFDNNVEGSDILCIAPNGAIFHLRWEGSEEFNDEKGSTSIIGSLATFPPKSDLLIYNPDGSKENGIRGFNKIKVKNVTSSDTYDSVCNVNVNIENVGGQTSSSDSSDSVFNVLGIDEERVVAGCTRGWIRCFELNI